MTFEIRFAPEAEDTYESVISQLYERWGEKFVVKFEARLEKALMTLSHSPFIYPLLAGSTQVRKCILHKNLFASLYSDWGICGCAMFLGQSSRPYFYMIQTFKVFETLKVFNPT